MNWDELAEMSKDDLMAEWRQLGQRLEARGEEALRQGLECAYAATVDESDAIAHGYGQSLARFMVDVQALIDHQGSGLLWAIIRASQMPEPVLEAALGMSNDHGNLRDLCSRLFSMVMLTERLGDHHVDALYGNAERPDLKECAPGTHVRYEDYNPGLSSGLGTLHEVASEIIAQGPTLETIAKLWDARLGVSAAHCPLSFEGIQLIYWAARRLTSRHH